ncbi:hypothetical protein PAXRUDRAFT_272015 [Paxillus rubicundulus Ve08.2h10]|uniref:Uncharacterized protein n=1 Tax=Paxillus rubicundulus Ve08.2h10 TaxID=930991 RepID=A0A0D0DT53_9AGAM|nr:hypothetical protein PAXRUDRAFT_272015 [Paxillus rubicundulus Ve08.2h10]
MQCISLVVLLLRIDCRKSFLPPDSCPLKNAPWSSRSRMLELPVKRWPTVNKSKSAEQDMEW